ncbi:MAG: hypothetical protein A3D19_08245 [Deltaproteobacteria bacterium RIFCSPHIGHO2_02_FULL_38_15]|nr:MAG: hypothetical protein A3D19_08245 [Deltaproteobacteria bacterium RIFCSPHIGHO2_02_FULL_38_15]HBQ21491.1 hypothetical protein [Deltaproteobacteria bacterium]
MTSNMKKAKIKSFLIQILKLAFAVAIFVYLITSGKVDLVRVKDAFLHSYWTILSLLMGLVTLLITTWRWRLLLTTQGIRISFKKALKLVFIGHFFNIVIPGTVSGDVVKAYYISKTEKNKMAAALSVVMDRFIGLMMLTVVTFCAVIFNFSFVQSVSELKILGQMIMGGFGIVVIGFLFFLFRKNFSLSSRWPIFLRDMTESFWAYRKHLGVIFLAGIMTVINFIANVILYYAAVRALGENALPIAQYFFLLPLGMFVMSIPIAPAGLGVGQSAFLKLFEWAYGRPTTIGADMMTIVQMVIVVWALVGLLVYVLNREKMPVNAPSEKEVLSV